MVFAEAFASPNSSIPYRGSAGARFDSVDRVLLPLKNSSHPWIVQVPDQYLGCIKLPATQPDVLAENTVLQTPITELVVMSNDDCSLPLPIGSNVVVFSLRQTCLAGGPDCVPCKHQSPPDRHVYVVVQEEP